MTIINVYSPSKLASISALLLLFLAAVGRSVLLCSDNDSEPIPDTFNPRRFWTCQNSSYGRIWTSHECPKDSQTALVFDAASKQCLSPQLSYTLSAVGASLVGERCMFNTDCLQGMYCNAGLCTCLSTYIEITKYCYKKINPSQAGCQYDVQCDAVWPLATCVSSVCQCPTNYVPVQTRDGYVCITTLLLSSSGRCPLPDGLGELSALTYDKPPNFDPATCIVGRTESQNPKSTCYSNDDGTGEYMGDRFDCLPQDITNPSAAQGSPGICCPNRAYTCIQALTSSPPSPFAPAEKRWWYNSVTGRCISFQFSPPEQSSNNFLSEQQCLSYCAPTCRRGLSQYNTKSNIAEENVPKTCASDGLCDADGNYDCTTIGTQKFCCSSKEFICGRYGGLPLPAKPELTFSVGYTFPLTPPSTRYYFDEDSRVCLSFEYQGIGGNFNNFLTIEDCEDFCQPVFCPKGRALRDGSGVNRQSCSSSDPCPTTHTCNIDVCCPRKQTLCGEPQEVGSCQDYKVRYWYNAKTRECEQFLYSGCQGNDNNFETFPECEEYCRNAISEPVCRQGGALKTGDGNYAKCYSDSDCPVNHECYFDGSSFGCCPLKSYTCTRSFDVGDKCGAVNTRWYYDTSLSTCISFTYLGCNGNSNNFASQQLCLSYCGRAGCPFGAPLEIGGAVVRNCDQPGIACPESYECTTVNLGATVQKYCCPTRVAACTMPPSQEECSTGSKPVVRYYFNAALNDCIQYYDYGCVSNNANKFATFRQCLQFCASTGCKNGEVVLSTTGCKIDSDCQNGYRCRYDQLSRTSKCCGSANYDGVCPLAERPYIDAMTLRARECEPNVVGTCPNAYLCRFSQSTQKYYCCITDENVCPDGKQLISDPLTQNPQLCYLSNVINVCPNGYSCQTISHGTEIGYCCSTLQPCPSGVTYAKNQQQQPVTCTTGVGAAFNTCPSGYYCYTTSTSNQPNGICCQSGNYNCPTGSAGLHQFASGSIQMCDRSRQCQFPYTCTPVSSSVSLCCSRSSMMRHAQHPTARNVQRQNIGMSHKYYCLLNRDCQGSLDCINGSCTCAAGSRRVQDQCVHLQALQCFLTNLEPIIDLNQRLCDPNVRNFCPDGYNCSTSNRPNIFICCKRVAEKSPPKSELGDMCPATSFVLKKSNNVVKCLSTSCPDGYYCHFNPRFYNYFCCSNLRNNRNGIRNSSQEISIGGSAYCQTGNEFLYPMTTIPLACSAQKDLCPPNYRCLYSGNYQRHICCQTTITLQKQPTIPFSPIKLNKVDPPSPKKSFTNASRTCNLKARSYIGGPCCDDIQCQFKCKAHRDKNYCVCPRNLMVDASNKPGRCVSVCLFWRDGAFCYQRNRRRYP